MTSAGGCVNWPDVLAGECSLEMSRFVRLVRLCQTYYVTSVAMIII